ncbi:MAG: D-glycero-beta-D-manno-heptose 1-phosphate adenylyltransferase [Acidobacteria bacterium]|nr:D-glycero-beta-D-manno-heptose 1-phosphate adenylyltransferase [Acidobacteriota bacterium]
MENELVGLEKLKQLAELQQIVRREQAHGRRVVFTNGCFDLLHAGHIHYLREAAAQGDILIIALNSDDSVRRLKGAARPIQPEEERAEILCALAMVDYVTIFAEDTPQAVIRTLLPDVLVKGGDWTPDNIVGRQEVEAAGGRVLSLPFTPGYSTTGLIDKIRSAFGRR